MYTYDKYDIEEEYHERIAIIVESDIDETTAEKIARDEAKIKWQKLKRQK